MRVLFRISYGVLIVISLGTRQSKFEPLRCNDTSLKIRPSYSYLVKLHLGCVRPDAAPFFVKTSECDGAFEPPPQRHWHQVEEQDDQLSRTQPLPGRKPEWGSILPRPNIRLLNRIPHQDCQSRCIHNGIRPDVVISTPQGRM